jgi:hypothetical protein
MSGNGVVYGGSVLAATVAGTVALLAPCCILVLLPPYFASSFHNRRVLVAMTFLLDAWGCHRGVADRAGRGGAAAAAGRPAHRDLVGGRGAATGLTSLPVDHNHVASQIVGAVLAVVGLRWALSESP